MNRRWLRLQMSLLALVAIPEVERRAAEWQARDGQPVPGEVKRHLALEHMLAAWPDATRCIPGLNLTLISERRRADPRTT